MRAHIKDNKTVHDRLSYILARKRSEAETLKNEISCLNKAVKILKHDLEILESDGRTGVSQP